jgi:modulator of FtsH protease HflC
MRAGFGAIVAIAIVLLLLAATALYTVDQRQSAIVFQFGEVKEVVTEPGLHFKVPMIQNVRFYDMRILTLDSPDAERFVTSENKPVLVDSFVKWRIMDVREYYLRTGGDERQAQSRLADAVNAGLRDEFGVRTVVEVVTGERDKIMERMRERANQVAKQFGILIVDVRLKRVELPQEVSEAVYRRMESERRRVANELRSTGAGEGEKIRADADRQRSVLLAEAYKDAQRIKGEGDARAAAVYNKAFGANPEFYNFYRSLDAYKATFKSRADVMVLEPTSDFFRYLKNPNPPPRGR